MQMPRILRSNKTNNSAKEGQGGGGLDVEQKWSNHILNLLCKSRGKDRREGRGG